MDSKKHEPKRHEKVEERWEKESSAENVAPLNRKESKSKWEKDPEETEFKPRNRGTEGRWEKEENK